MKLARPAIGETRVSASEGSNPSPSTRGTALTPVGGTEDKTAAFNWKTETLVDTPHLIMLDSKLVVRGMVVTGREATMLPWRRKKDNEPASQAEIARELELVAALAIRGKIQVPSDFASTKLYLREDVK